MTAGGYVRELLTQGLASSRQDLRVRCVYSGSCFWKALCDGSALVGTRTWGGRSRPYLKLLLDQHRIGRSALAVMCPYDQGHFLVGRVGGRGGTGALSLGGVVSQRAGAVRPRPVGGANAGADVRAERRAEGGAVRQGEGAAPPTDDVVEAVVQQSQVSVLAHGPGRRQRRQRGEV